MSKRSTVKGPTFGGDHSKTFSYGSIEPVSSSTDRDHSQISSASKVELRRFSATSATSDALPDPLAYLDLPDSVLPATRYVIVVNFFFWSITTLHYRAHYLTESGDPPQSTSSITRVLAHLI